jgi:hypothetical protein
MRSPDLNAVFRASRAALAALALSGMASAPALAQEAEGGDNSRAIFDAEVCKVDALTAAQCDCAWKFVTAKMSGQDLRLGMLLTASGSETQETANKADAQLDKMKISEKRQDAVSSEISALIIEAEDACP